MTVLNALILGIVQGLTEFLPVSSSGHLVLLQRILGVKGEVVAFDVLLHTASLAAVAFTLRAELLALIKKPLSAKMYMLITATIPAVIAALLLDGFIEDAFSGAYLGYGFLLTAAMLIVCDVIKPPKQALPLSPKGAIAMGLGQAVAVLPGISRSGATITAGVLAGESKAEAARFSFLMSIPIILGSAVIKLPRLGATENVLPLVVGFVAAFIAALVSVKLMLRLIQKRRLYGFSIYLAVLGAFTLLNQYLLRLF